MLWYRTYSDKWIEQGKYQGATSATVNFLKAFKNTNYCIAGAIIPGNYNQTWEHFNYSGFTTSSFYFNSIDGYSTRFFACGY